MEDDCVVLGDRHVLGESERRFYVLKVLRTVFESDSGFLVDEFAACKNSNVLENSLPVVSERWCFDCAYLEVVLESVEDESCEELALDVVSDDEQRLLLLVGEFKEGQHVPDVGELLLDYQNVAVLELDLLLLVVSHEVGRNEPPVELHAVHKFDLVVQSLSVLDGYSAVNAYLFVEFGQHISNGSVSVG